MPDSLGDRMKQNYENRARYQLMRRTPVIMRLDGKAFHTFTRHCEKPFDQNLIDTMAMTARYVMENVQGSVFAYVQSDEISILLQDYANLDTSAWFDYNIQKMTSISAAMASVFFSSHYKPKGDLDCGYALFDSRVFNLPREEVINYFIWRQQDWTRNSLQMLARAHFSQKELHRKNAPAMHEMLHAKHINWADLHPQLKNGTIIVRELSEYIFESFITGRSGYESRF